MKCLKFLSVKNDVVLFSVKVIKFSVVTVSKIETKSADFSRSIRHQNLGFYTVYACSVLLVNVQAAL